MATKRLRVTQPQYVALRALPDPWQPGQLLTIGGASKRDTTPYEGYPPDHPIWQQLPEQGRRYLVVVIGDEPGEVDIEVTTHQIAPPLDLDSWDSIEEAGAEFEPETIEAHNQLGLDFTDDLREVLTTIPAGWNMLRVSKRRATQPPSVDVHIDIWPIDGPADLNRIKHQPKPRRSRKAHRSGVDVETHWWRITSILQHAGAATPLDSSPNPRRQNPAHVKDIAASTGQEWPQELTQWFTTLSGYPDGRWTTLFPSYDLLTAEQSLHSRNTSLAAMSPSDTDYPSTAGEPAYTFIPEYIPIGDRDGYLLVCDTRPGPRHGTILTFDKVDADDDATTWKSISHFLGDLADALEDRQPFLGYKPEFPNNTLTWTYNRR